MLAKSNFILKFSFHLLEQVQFYIALLKQWLQTRIRTKMTTEVPKKYIYKNSSQACRNNSISGYVTETVCILNGIKIVQERSSAIAVFIWVLLLLVIVFLNVLVIYAAAQIKILRQNAYHRVILSNFLANILYAFGCCCKHFSHEKMSCDNLTAFTFLEVFGALACILGVMALSILQYCQLKSLDVNNKLSNHVMKRKRQHAIYHLLYVWTLGFIFSTTTLPLGISENLPLGTKNILLIPIIASSMAIMLCIFFTCKTFMTITNHRKHLRRNSKSTFSDNLIRTERLLKGTGIILLVCWIPTIVGKLMLIYLPSDQTLKKTLYFVVHSALSYPILHPILYGFKTKEVKKFIINRVIKCQSKDFQKEDEFFQKLQVRKKFRRSMKIKPFIIERQCER